jgi:hypothetical protein
MGLNYNPASVIDGLVYYLDIMNTRCYSGTGNTLYNLANSAIGTTIVSGITYDTDFKKNLNFNGSSGYMFSNDTSLDFTNKDFTIQTTLKLNGLSNGFTGSYGSMICAGAALTNNSSIFRFSGTATSYYALALWHQPTSTAIERNYNFQTNKIYNLAVTKNTTQIEFFVDGVSVGTASTTSTFNFTANGFAIGRWYYPGSEQYLKGSIFDFKAYNRALTNDEIVQNYNSSKGRYITPENIVTNGLILNIDPANSSSYSGIGNTIYDLSGSGNTGTLTNSPTFSALNSGSITFDGSSNYIDLTPTGTGISLTSSSDFNVSGWIYVEATQPKIAPSVVEKYNGVGGYPLAIRWGSNTLYTIVYDGTNSAAAGASITPNTWAYFSANNILSQKKLEMYMNSSLIGSTTYSTLNNITTTASIKIGYRGFDSNTYFAGKLAKLQIYNRALSATEIQQNYNATKGRFGL